MFWRAVAYVFALSIPCSITLTNYYRTTNEQLEDAKRKREYNQMRRDALGNKSQINTVVARVNNIHNDNATSKADTPDDKNRE